jgi:hypothetical protein
MARRDEFEQAHDVARNHADVFTDVRKPSKPNPKWAEANLSLRSKGGGYQVYKKTMSPQFIEWDEHMRRERHRWLEENG